MSERERRRWTVLSRCSCESCSLREDRGFVDNGELLSEEDAERLALHLFSILQGAEVIVAEVAE